MEEDAYAIRAIASAGLPALVSNSFSKNFLPLRRARRRTFLFCVKMPKPQAAYWGN